MKNNWLNFLIFKDDVFAKLIERLIKHTVHGLKQNYTIDVYRSASTEKNRRYLALVIEIYNRTSRKRAPKMQRLGGRLRKAVAYESRTAKAKFLYRPRMEWYIYSKKNNESLLFPANYW